MDSIASKLQVFEIEPNAISAKDLPPSQTPTDKNSEHKEPPPVCSSSLAVPTKSERTESPSKITVERSSSKIDQEKPEKPTTKEQAKTSTSNKSAITSAFLKKNLLPSKKSKILSADEKTQHVELTDEQPLTKSQKIYTQIANSTSHPLTTTVDEYLKYKYDNNETTTTTTTIMDMDLTYYHMLINKENEFIRNELQANRLQKKIFKKLRVEKNASFGATTATSLMYPSVSNFTASNSTFMQGYMQQRSLNSNTNTNSNNNNLFDCYKFYERTRNTE